MCNEDFNTKKYYLGKTIFLKTCKRIMSLMNESPLFSTLIFRVGYQFQDPEKVELIQLL